jgi:hypothetical protein
MTASLFFNGWVIFAVVALFHLVRILNRHRHCRVANRLEIRQDGSR